MKKILIIALVLCIISFFAGGEGKNNSADSMDGSTEESMREKKICILYYKSPNGFNDILVKKVKAELDQFAGIVIDDIKNYKNNPADIYSVILIISNARFFSPFPSAVSKFFGKNRESKNIVYYASALAEFTVYNRSIRKNGVQAITAASKKENVDRIVAEIVLKVKEKFENGNIWQIFLNWFKSSNRIVLKILK